MSDKKDFLSQFSTNNKPDSFKEEERIPVTRAPKKINIKLIIIGIIALIVIAIIVFLLVFSPKIKVENFVGLKKEDAIAWIRQQSIETSGIIFKEEYNFDIDKDIVLAQEPLTGKVTNKAKMTFTVSKGPDPDEKIKVPDFTSMDKEQINSWIKTNKLLSTKINTTYSEDVEADGFIKAEYSGCEEDSFTRGCSLKISISKGEKPKDEITMVDFVKKTYAELEAWATPKKIKLNKSETYSDTVDAGLIISQSVKEGEKVKADDTINVVVSKGKGIKVPDFSVMTKTKIDEWVKENAAYVKYDEVYSHEGTYVIYQSAKTNSYIGSDNKLQLTLNLGDSFYLSDVSLSTSISYDKFVDLANQLIEKGIQIEVHDTYEESSTSRGTVLDVIDIYDESGRHYSKTEKLPLVVDIRCSVSDGMMIEIPSKEYLDNKTISDFANWLNSNIKVSYQPKLTDYKTGLEIKNPTSLTQYKIKQVYYFNDPISKVNGLIQGGANTKLSIETNEDLPNEYLVNEITPTPSTEDKE